MDKIAAQLAVSKGMNFLDEAMPGWHNKINLEILQINNGTTCIIGQLNGGSLDGGWDKTFPTLAYNEVWPMGFVGTPTNNDILTAEWKKQIEIRREIQKDAEHSDNYQ